MDVSNEDVAELMKEIKHLRTQMNSLVIIVNTLNIKLFGTLEGHSDHGRFVQLEKRVLIDTDRINKLENWRYYILGGFAAVGFTVYMIIETFSKVVK